MTTLIVILLVVLVFVAAILVVALHLLEREFRATRRAPDRHEDEPPGIT